MANRVVPCPRCKFPLLIVPDVTAGVCPGCRKPFTLGAGSQATEAAGGTWPRCDGADRVGDVYYFRGKTYTIFAAVRWKDLSYDCSSTELYLINDAGDEISLEYEEDDDGNTVWWLDEDATGQVQPQGDGSVLYKGKRYQAYAASGFNYEAQTCAGAFDVPYDQGEGKVVKWYTDFTGDLGERRGRLGFTRELDQDTWFWMSPVPAPVLHASAQFATARSNAWAGQNKWVILGTVAAVLGALALHIAAGVTAPPKAVYRSGALLTPQQRHWVSDAFEIEGRTSHVEAKVQVEGAGLSGWMDTTLCLANLGTQRRYCIVVEVDNQSRWTGAAFEGTKLFSSIPAGRYVLEGQAETETQSPLKFDVELVRNARRTGTLWVALGVLAGIAVLVPLSRYAAANLRQRSSEEVGQFVMTAAVILMVLLMAWFGD